MALYNDSYFYSNNVKVFPCSFRGRYTVSNKQMAFDPESRLNTEYNFTHLPGIGNNLTSYILSYNSTTEELKCVIGGYYFEISDFSLSDLKVGNKVKNLYVKFREVTIQDGVDPSEIEADKIRTTKVLTGWTSQADLDVAITSIQYYFTGIKCLYEDEALGYDACLVVAKLNDSGEVTLNYEAMLPAVYHGIGDGSIRLADSININTETNTINTASGNGSFAHGHNTSAYGAGSHSEGYSTTAGDEEYDEDHETYAHAEGKETIASMPYSHTEGQDTIAESIASHSEGSATKTTGGDYITISGKQYYSRHAEGIKTIASAVGAHAEGKETRAFNEGAHAEGQNTLASGKYAHAEGAYTVASIDYSHAEGYDTQALSNSAHAEGYNTKATGVYSHAEGFRTIASGQASHAEGYSGGTSNNNTPFIKILIGTQEYISTETDGTKIYDYDIVEELQLPLNISQGMYLWGENTKVAQVLNVDKDNGKLRVRGDLGYASGSGEIKLYAVTVASGNYSHAEGTGTVANGMFSHAEGIGTMALDLGSSAKGNHTIAYSEGATAIGRYTIAGKSDKTKGKYSFTAGNETVSETDYQTVVGKYNSKTAGEFIVGSGTSDISRKNALVVNGSTTTLNNKLVINNGLQGSTAKDLFTVDASLGNSKTEILTSTNTIDGSENTINGRNSTNIKISNRNKIAVNATNLTLTNRYIDIEGSTSLTTTAATYQHKVDGNVKLQIDDSFTAITNDRIALVSNGEQLSNQLTIYDRGILLDGNTQITKYLTVDSGKIFLGNNPSVQGDIYWYSSINPVLRVYGSSTQNNYATLFGGNGATVITSGGNGRTITPSSAPSDPHLSLNAGKDVYISTNTAPGFDKRYTWSFTNTGKLICPGIIDGTINTTCVNGGSKDLLYATMGNNDFFKLTVEGANDTSKVTIATADNGNEPIVFEQWKCNSQGTAWYEKAHQFYALNAQGKTEADDLVINNAFNFAGSKVYMLSTNSESAGTFNVNNKMCIHDTGYIYTHSSITALGDIYGNTFHASSDARLKENIIEYKPSKSILDLPIYKYDFINGSKNNIGCLAQDLKEICPEIVHENAKGYLNIEESKIVYLLLDEVKKLKEEVKKLSKEK